MAQYMIKDGTQLKNTQKQSAVKNADVRNPTAAATNAAVPATTAAAAQPTATAPSTVAQDGTVLGQAAAQQQRDQINAMYDANRAQQLANLESAYQQSLSDRQASMEQLIPQYQQRANDLAVQYERNRRNLNEQAIGNGINTGAGSQQRLALQDTWQRDYGALMQAQQQALNEAQRQIDNLRNTYQSNVQAAISQNDYQKAAALLNQYKIDYQNQITLASNLAKYGDFSGYNGLYSDDQIAAMQQNWAASNPDLAYNTGAIDGERYKEITGKYPAGYKKPSSGGGGGSSGGGGVGGNVDNAGMTNAQTKDYQSNLNAALKSIGSNVRIAEDGLRGPETQAAEKILNDYNQRQMIHGMH